MWLLDGHFYASSLNLHNLLSHSFTLCPTLTPLLSRADSHSAALWLAAHFGAIARSIFRYGNTTPYVDVGVAAAYVGAGAGAAAVDAANVAVASPPLLRANKVKWNKMLP